MWTLGDRLRIARESVTPSQGKFAAMTGISRNTVSRYEADQVVRVKSYVVRTWADVTGFSYDWLMTGEVPESGPVTSADTCRKWRPDSWHPSLLQAGPPGSLRAA